MATPTTTFYRFRSTVARVIRSDAGIDFDVFDVSRRRWVAYPELFASIFGVGGDGLDVISRDQARAIVDAVGAPA